MSTYTVVKCPTHSLIGENCPENVVYNTGEHRDFPLCERCYQTVKSMKKEDEKIRRERRIPRSKVSISHRRDNHIAHVSHMLHMGIKCP